ncbi:MAG: protein tyrosine phosphatase family protein [Pseudomonadota bacterium]|nr:protein tyrosine phosphatase family protein [Pseudomonadota bacterium]
MTPILPVFDDVYSAGQPTEAELAALARNGVRTIINLRHRSEASEFDEADVVAAMGMGYVSIPVTGAQDLTPETITRFSRELEDARSRGPVLVHCGSGNRVGAMIALEQAWVRRQSVDRALAAGRAAGLAGLEPAVIERLADGWNFRCGPESSA